MPDITKQEMMYGPSFLLNELPFPAPVIPKVEKASLASDVSHQSHMGDSVVRSRTGIIAALILGFLSTANSTTPITRRDFLLGGK